MVSLFSRGILCRDGRCRGWALGLRVFDDGWGVRWFNVEWGDALEDAPEGPMLWGLAETLGCDDCMIV
jgi:hypothetical protein